MNELEKWKTKKQWLKNGYVFNNDKILIGTQGKELNKMFKTNSFGFNHKYFYIDDVFKNEELAKETLEEERLRRRIKEEIRIENIKKANIEWCTYYQWLNQGYVFNENKNVISSKGEKLNARFECFIFGSSHYYFHIDCMEYNPTKAIEEIKNYKRS